MTKPILHMGPMNLTLTSNADGKTRDVIIKIPNILVADLERENIQLHDFLKPVFDEIRDGFLNRFQIEVTP